MIKDVSRFKSVFRDLFLLKGCRNRVHYHICLVISCTLIYLLTVIFIEFDRTYVPAFISDNVMRASTFVDIIDVILLFLLLMILWVLVCNKAKRICDMGFNGNWALWIEAVRYSIIINYFLKPKQFNGTCIPVENHLTDIEFLIVFAVPIILGLFKGKFSNSSSFISDEMN